MRKWQMQTPSDSSLIYVVSRLGRLGSAGTLAEERAAVWGLSMGALDGEFWWARAPASAYGWGCGEVCFCVYVLYTQ